jgi:L,D-peptidoglycan transpeptidase YkuD (ErfK/YbiS/YcfS/YnhG family)
MVKTKLKSRKPKNAPAKLSRLVVTAQPRIASQKPLGRLQAGATTFVCAIGATSISHHKREGDKATPVGHFRLIEGFFKPGVGGRPATLLPIHPIRRTLGWCEDPAAPAYNRPINLPSRVGHETMWRDDGVYDFVIVLDYNLRPRRRFLGSAIFLHCARPGFSPTGGCVALNAADLRKLLPRLARGAKLIVR